MLPFQYAYYFVCPEPYLALPKVVALRDWLLGQAQAVHRRLRGAVIRNGFLLRLW